MASDEGVIYPHHSQLTLLCINLLCLQENVDAGIVGCNLEGPLETSFGLITGPCEPELIGEHKEEHRIRRLSIHQLSQMIDLFLKIILMISIEQDRSKLGFGPIGLQAQAGV